MPTTHYPYRARALMRFKAQDGQFVLSPNTMVTVTAPTDEDGDWVNVTSEDGQSGSVPSGFLVQFDDDDIAGGAEKPGVPVAGQPTPNVVTEAVHVATIDNKTNPSQPPSGSSAAEPPPSPPVSKLPRPLPGSQPSSMSEEIGPTSSSSQPPPPVSKPNALRDRIAMFNKAPSAPPPPGPGSLRPKPPLARKPLHMPPPVSAVSGSEPNEPLSVAPDSEPPHTSATAGMSAADAEEAVRAGGSLKDRIKLLQQQQQQATEASDTPPSPAPKPKREWKRPVAPPSSEDQPPILGMMPPTLQRMPTKDTDGGDPDHESSNLPSTSDSVPNPPSSSSLSKDETAIEETEDDDVARRRRIAERMAKLGGAKMGFGFPGPPLSVKPSIPPKARPDDTENKRSDEASVTASEPALPPESIAMPAIPKRAGPPRRKAPAPAAAPSQPVPEKVVLPAEQNEVSGPDETVTSTQADQTHQEVNAAEPTLADALQSINQRPEVITDALEEEALTKAEISDSNQTYQPLDDQHESHPSSIRSEKEGVEDELTVTGKVNHLDSSSPDVLQPVEPDDASIGPSLIDTPLSQEGGTTETAEAISQPSHSPKCTLEALARPSGSGPTSKGFQEEPDDGQSDAYQYGLPSAHSSVLTPTRAETLSTGDDEEDSETREALLEDQAGSETQTLTDDLAAGFTHPAEVQTFDRLPPITPRPPLPATPATPLDGNRESFAKKMAAISDQPLFPPLSPRGGMRRPSGPREPNSPSGNLPDYPSSLVDEPLDSQLATQKGSFEREHDGIQAPSDTSLPPPISARPLPTLESTVAGDDADDSQASAHNLDIYVPEPNQVHESSDNVQEEEEDEETARRRRLAERMAKMGARPMMGGMMPMLPSSGSSSGLHRRPTTSNTSGNNPSPNVPSPIASGPPPPVPSSRPLPSLPGASPPSPDASPTPSGNIASAPRRAAPSPTYRAPSSSMDQTTDEKSKAPMSPSPPMPSAQTPSLPALIDARSKPPTRSPPPPQSPASRPRIPTAYQNVPKRTSTLSQPGLTWAQVDDSQAMAAEAMEGSDNSGGSDDEELGPPPIPTQRPPMVQRSMSLRKESAEPIRSGSFESTRSSNQRLSVSEKDPSNHPSPKVLNTGHQLTDDSPKCSHSSQKPDYKARDLDLASERWWRTKPVSLPTSVQRMTDVLARIQGSSTLTKGVPTYQYELVVIRDDYSKTVVRIYFEEGEGESETEMAQTHYPPPVPYPIATLQELSASIGPQLVARAKAREDEKGVKFSASEENGKLFVGTIVKSVAIALEPVGETFGEVIYKCEIQDFKGAHPEIDVKDDIRPGDIVASYGATFKGKGIGHNSMNLGTVTNAHVAIVAEHDVKKNKFKAYGIWHGKVELLSYRLDELKSGSIKVFRVLDKKFLEN
ncbi:hypothetical protein CROQUDRAFT_131670 [Cronartium quercuum f. sp. fusiforme G11]|uniref:SH3 domain-containing protein n=1 Tax=Cronartium quercuum f. sp. fusiforme G11 TaxID=708437 RepID=A0A9P6NNG2_9BASI|nr:hypothetical protein CROQUDRAFT_131670 [Cronartium quercuum f. sp. fusiforme G11]